MNKINAMTISFLDQQKAEAVRWLSRECNKTWRTEIALALKLDPPRFRVWSQNVTIEIVEVVMALASIAMAEGMMAACPLENATDAEVADGTKALHRLMKKAADVIDELDDKRRS